MLFSNTGILEAQGWFAGARRRRVQFCLDLGWPDTTRRHDTRELAAATNARRATALGRVDFVVGPSCGFGDWFLHFA